MKFFQKTDCKIQINESISVFEPMQKQDKITPIFYSVQDVGKNIKNTKKRFTWVLELDQKIITFVLDTSIISGKVKLTCNNQIVAMTEQQPLATFQHKMLINENHIVIMAIAPDLYEMRINNQVFNHLLNQERTKKEFIKNHQACEDFVLDHKITAANTETTGLKKTIKLKIGSMKTVTGKPSIKSVQSQDWAKMMGEEANSFPNYFDLPNNGSSAQQVDYSKVSMKKKSPQPQKQTKQGTLNLLESQTQNQVIEITPEQFCTMQEMFRTQVPIKNQNLKTSNDNSTKTCNTPSVNDFSTMQMFFQTQCGNPVTTLETKSTEPVEISISAQDFSTMQWMFNTMSVETSATGQQTEKQEQAPKASSLLNEICPQTTENQSIQNMIPQININDFSTMQMMFASNNMNICNQTSANNPLSNVTINQQINSTKIQTDDSSNSTSNPNPMNFSTMADLFKTMNFQQPQATTALQQSSQQPKKPYDALSALSLSNLSNNANTQNINMNDFSTMQMLFKTNGVVMPQMMQKAATANKVELKQNSVPFEFSF